MQYTRSAACFRSHYINFIDDTSQNFWRTGKSLLEISHRIDRSGHGSINTSMKCALRSVIDSNVTRSKIILSHAGFVIAKLLVDPQIYIQA